jgi:hypothetical protein
MRTNKFRKGKLINSIPELWIYLSHRRWIYMGSRPKHPSVLMNMSLITLAGFIRRNSLWVAVERTRALEAE